MTRLNNLQSRLMEYWIGGRRNAFSATLFYKALLVFTMVKVLFIWSVSSDIVPYHILQVPRSVIIQLIFLPALWASKHIHLFYGSCLVVLTVMLAVRMNYLSGFLFFWITLNLFRINQPIVNGSDYVLFMLSFWAIGMGAWPIVKNEKIKTIQILVFNMSVLMCQVQIVFIYLISGWDKLTSKVWQSGDAIAYISHLDYRFNQSWFGFAHNPFLNLTLSWMTIVFELAFVVLIWFNRTRFICIAIGVFFHLVIWVMLSLPDFGLIMIVSYLIFLKDSDYKLVRGLKFEV